MSTQAPSGQQLSLTDAFDRAPTREDTIQDDRVVESIDTCRECDARPAGADGLCPPCRQQQWGGQMGGRRL